jgi:PAS domain S-box-containing protein
MIPDMKTVMLLYAIINGICALFMAILWYFNRKRFAGLSFWMIDMFFQAAGSLLIVLRGRIPDFLSLTVANILIGAGILIVYIGLNRFVGKKSVQTHNYILIAVFIAVQVYFSYFQSNLAVRTFNVTILTLIFTFQCALLMFCSRASNIRRSAAIVGIVFTGYALISIIRMILLIIFPLHSSDFFKTGAPDTFTIILYIMLATGLTFSLILMVNSRLISDIREYARQKEENAEKFSKAFQTSPYAITITRAKDGEIIEVNDAFISITGFSREEADVSSSINLKLWVDSKNREGVLSALKEGIEVKDREFQFRKKNGETIIGLFSAQIIHINNEVFILSSINDITERKHMEEKLLLVMEEFKRSNNELEHFAYVASHDLQEPLRAISSYAQLLEKRYKDKLDADAQDFINYIVNGAKRMHQLINDLLDYSKAGSSGRILKETDCNAVLATAIANLDTSIKKYHVVINHGDLPLLVADEVQMVQLFQNLLDNAIKYRSKKNPVINISAERQGNEWVFSVNDNGVGIDPKYFDRIFIIFQRLHRDEYPGTGIGLAICKKIVEGYGGRFWVESEPGKGSIFYFTIPCKTAKTVIAEA